MSDLATAIVLRPPQSDKEWRFVVKSWVRDYAHPRNPFAGALSRERLIRATKGTIFDLLQRPNCYLLLAVNAEDDDQLFGFVCFERTPTPVLHYVYVKQPLRGEGIGTFLVDVVRGESTEPLRYTFRTPLCRKILRDAKHDWNLARRDREKEKQ